MSDSYRVPKRSVSVQLRTVQFGFEEVTVFLNDLAESHAGPESPLDLFNAQSAFLPVRLADATMRFVSIEQVMTVGLPPTLPEEAEPFCGTVEKVAVLMEDGNVLEGGFAYELPDGSQRLQDFLNQEVRFALLHTAEGEVLINKRRISHVSVL
ncbi:MAG: hypothetical protein JRH16_11565 [Deltaproteobacteria bacterium]|nr:hypothetical protein [Deltaproteobacteria bacterium]MBW2363023.1 hypothetical protein [Deltaproteobacteria bacterium]